MKICLLVLAIVILQGVAVNSQSSTIDSIMSMANRAYQLYQQGQLIPTLRQYVREAINGLTNLQNSLSPSLPAIGRSSNQWNWGKK